MRTVICKTCLSELDPSSDGNREDVGTFPALSALGGLGGTAAALAMMNPLFVPAGLILGLAADAACTRCGSHDDLYVAVTEEDDDEDGKYEWFLEPPPPVRRPGTACELGEGQEYSGEAKVPSDAGPGKGEMSQSGGNSPGMSPTVTQGTEGGMTSGTAGSGVAAAPPSASGAASGGGAAAGSGAGGAPGG